METSAHLIPLVDDLTHILIEAGGKIATKPWAGEQEVYKIQAQGVEEDFIPVASIRSVGLKRSKSTS